MCVQRNYQLCLGKPFPHSRIHLVMSNHPSQEEIQPLHGASLAWVRQQKARLAFHAILQFPHESRQSGKKGRGCRFHSSFKAGTQRTIDLNGSLQTYQQGHQIFTLGEPVPKIDEIVFYRAQATRLQVMPRPPNTPEQSLHRPVDLRNTSEGERGCDKTRKLLVLFRLIPMHEMQRIRVDATMMICSPVQTLKSGPQRFNIGFRQFDDPFDLTIDSILRSFRSGDRFAFAMPSLSQRFHFGNSSVQVHFTNWFTYIRVKNF